MKMLDCYRVWGQECTMEMAGELERLGCDSFDQFHRRSLVRVTQ